MKPLLLAIDSGSTAIKVAVFDADGALVARGAASTPRAEQAPGRVERDPEEHWRTVATAVRTMMTKSDIDPRRIIAIGLAAQGDGVHLVGENGHAVGPAILSSDSRAAYVIERWAADGTLDELRRLTGQVPFPGSPAPLLRALREEQPGLLDRARWLLSSKDWLRLRMTGEVATDRTDAAASFADVETHGYSAAALDASGLDDLSGLLPEILEPADLAGRLSHEAAELMGLVAGTPVAAGLHDVAAAVVGSVGLEPGRLCIIAGTFGVNVVLSSAPRPSSSVNIRSGPVPGLWSVRRTSRASISNIEWAARILDTEGDGDARTRAAISRVLNSEPRKDRPIYVPFLFGGNSGQPDSAAFFGVRSWHGSGDLLRAVIEGVTFNHRFDVEALEQELPIVGVTLAGGASRSPEWRRLFADVLGRSVAFAPDDDAGARGAAMCAAVVAGIHPDLAAASLRLAPRTRVVEPTDETDALQPRYRTFCDALAHATDFDAAHPHAALIPEGS